MPVLTGNAGLAGAGRSFDSIAELPHACRNIRLQGGTYCIRVSLCLIPLQRAELRNSAASRALFKCPRESPYRTGQRELNHGLADGYLNDLPFHSA